VKGENYAHTNIFLSNLFKPPVSFLIIESYWKFFLFFLLLYLIIGCLLLAYT
jgi:hypothetical protein